ncbi:TolC family protein [Sphingobium fluviale]|uniref:TolC family protein n=1 Tax=Sphingobium fluviale TaxID=2506423 RepID=A0A4Q1KDR6_9SPHN|nr:TolC family protein [Sphingobium fluviale]RXR25543.1 TolC family protein [Sphingobium fluviale]
MHKSLGAGLLLLLPAALRAEPLTFDAALQRAQNEAPSLNGREAGVRAAQSAAIAADRLPDPTLDIGIRDFPVTGPDAGRFNRDDFTMTTIGVSQQFINPAKRRARAERASAEIGLAEAEVSVEARNVRLETALAWIDLYYSVRRLEQLKLLDESLSDLQATVSARLASGSARPSQAFEPEQLRAQVADRRSALVAQIAKARARLARYTGDPNPSILGTPPELTVNRAALLAGVNDLPSLRTLDAQTAAMDAETRLARADKTPDWKVSASYGRREPRFGDLVSVGVSIDLPLFGRKRQDPRIAARALEAERARFDRLAGEREVIAELEGDLAEYNERQARLENARDNLVPLARKRAKLDFDSYGAGTVDLGTALLATLRVAEAEVDLLDREAEVARDAVRINMTYSGEQP